jgi:ATP-dependent DNA helicase RecG
MQDIQKKIIQGESETLEFKTSTTQLKGALETLCAFLNHKGGKVYIGVNNKGQCIGQDLTDSTRQEIARELNKLEPPVQVAVEYFPLENSKQIIILQVLTGQQAPYVYDGRPFERQQSTTCRMLQQRYDQLIKNRLQINYSWESFPAKDYSLADLDEELITGVIRKAVDVKRLPETALRQDLFHILERLELLKNGQLNNAAVALFGKRLNADFLQCELKLARFKGIDRHEFLDSDLIRSNLFELLEASLLFVRRHLPLAARIEPNKIERVEKPLIPFNAVREALLNALCHRSYDSHSSGIGLAIYDDRMEIFNHGGLTDGLSIETIKAGFSKPRNTLIANVLYRCNMIEQWGRGIQEIIKSCMAAGDPEPEFFSDAVQFKVVFKFSTSQKTPVFKINESSALLENLTERQHEIIVILKNDKYLKAKEIMHKLKKPIIERTLRRELAKLKKLGLINVQGHAHNASWFLIK